MFILKFFASIILLFFVLAILFVAIGVFMAKNFMEDLNDSIKNKFNNNENTQNFNNDAEIPSAIECPMCNTFYAQMPENERCSCGAKLK